MRNFTGLLSYYSNSGIDNFKATLKSIQTTTLHIEPKISSKYFQSDTEHKMVDYYSIGFQEFINKLEPSTQEECMYFNHSYV